MKDHDPKKKSTDTEEIQTGHDETYIEPEAIDGMEPEDLDSDEENV